MKPEQQAGFDKFWKEHWPKCRRKERKKAAAEWAKISPALYDTIYAAIERQKKQPSWNKDDCAYIPYPHRWLKGCRWEDEIALPEDRDAELLLTALLLNSSVPHDFPQHIMDRFRKMCVEQHWNWPMLHELLQGPKVHAEQVRKVYLATE